jgi:hypothetical protein
MNLPDNKFSWFKYGTYFKFQASFLWLLWPNVCETHLLCFAFLCNFWHDAGAGPSKVYGVAIPLHGFCLPTVTHERLQMHASSLGIAVHNMSQ